MQRKERPSYQKVKNLWGRGRCLISFREFSISSILCYFVNFFKITKLLFYWITFISFLFGILKWFLEPPHIDRVLTTKYIQRNSRLSLDCLASGTEPLTYQWYRNGKLLTSYSTTKWVHQNHSFIHSFIRLFIHSLVDWLIYRLID